MINRIKSISNRTLALILSLLMLLSSGIVGTLAANVDLVPTGADIKGYIYYDNSLTKWSSVQVMVGHGSWSEGYLMTRIANTDIWYYNMSSTWGGATQIAVFNASSKWGGEGSSVSHRCGYMDQNSACKTFSTSYTSGVLLYGTSGSDGFALSMTSKTYTGLNTTQTATVQSAAAGTNVYNDDNAAGSTTISTYKLSSATGATASSGTTSASAARSATVTMTATANDGYTFKGWYNSSGTQQTTSTTLTYTCNGSAATYIARYEKATEVTATFKDHDGTILGTDTIDPGQTPTAPADPTREGYTFTGWSPAIGAIDEDTTYTAQYDIKEYSVYYFKDIDATQWTQKATVEYGTKVNAYSNAPTDVTKDSTNEFDYVFNGWVYKDGTPVSDTDIVKGDVNLYATFTPVTRSYTVTIVADNGDATVSYVNTEGNTVDVTSGMAVPYGTVLTLTATPDLFFNVGTWTANGATVTGTTYTVTGDVELVHTFASKTTYEVTIHQTTGLNGTVEAEADDDHDFAFDRMYNENSWVYKAEAGATVNFTVTAPNGYYIQRANMVNYTVDDTIVDFTIENVNAKTDISVIYAALPTYNVTVSANNADAGTVTGGNDAVIYGNKVNLTATPNEGYRFVNWTVEGTYSNVGFGDTLAVTSLIPQSNLTITANFAANSGVINVAKTEGGTVTNEGEHEVTYPETVTAVATANESDGYLFTHWTIESAGIKDTDYKVTENGNEITVQILTDGTVVTVTANFANAQKIKVYTYSDSGFNRLTMTESNGTDTLTPVNNVTQTPVTFGEDTWYTPGEVTLTAGYSDEITAQLLGDNPLEGGSGTLIMFNNVLGWSEVYVYASCSWNSLNQDNYGGAVPNTATDSYTMSNIKGTNYWYAYVSDINKFDTILFVNAYVNGWGDLNSGQKASYRGDAITNVNNNKPMFTPSTTITETGNGTPYYNGGSWAAVPTNLTFETKVADITEELYTDNAWNGLDEIWIYIKSDGTYIATTKDRRELIDEVNSALMKRTYNNGVNDMEYTSTSWTNFVNAYKAALTASGDNTLTNTQLDAKHTALLNAYNALETETNVTITGSHGAEPYSTADVNYGTIEFPGLTVSQHNNSGNIGDDNGYHYQIDYLTATVERGTTINIKTTLTDDYADDYLVYGWVVNGTEWVSATQDIDDTSVYVGTYTCNKSAVIIPVYFRKATIANWETDDNIVKIYASTTGSSDKWGNYISAYTWTNTKSYYQFGHWTGQIMIPDTSNPGMYYTFLEFTSPDGTDDIAGIAFTNYGGNNPINNNDRYQTYDYYEFKELKSLGYNNIVFQLKTFEGNINSPSTSGTQLSNYQFDYFRDFSGNMIDITREELTDEQKALEPELYIVRTGPVVAGQGLGYRQSLITGSDYYVDTYVYDKNGNFIVGCKSFELLDLDLLAEKSGKANLSTYAGKPVMVDYASLTYSGGSGENRRFDGEWYGTIYGVTNVTITAEVAYLNADGSIQYYMGDNDVEGVGQAYINGEHTQEVAHGSEGHIINATALNGNDFVGWYRATVNDDGTYTIDASAAPLFTVRSVTIDASADAVYVAVFKEHPEGTFTVNNYYYTYDDFKGQPMGEHKPPVFGGDTSYSIRDVRINKIKDYQGNNIADGDKGFAGTYTQSYDNIAVGDVLRITIKTTPTYKRDYVYAWYIQANEADGKVNFEEIGTDVIQNNFEPGVAKEFTFDYTVEPGVSSITIYSDVVHITPEVTFTYIYNNRYNLEQKYVVKYTLTGDELINYQPSNETIGRLAPYVGDIYKNVTWEIDNISSDATNWTLRASETDVYTVNVNVNGLSEQFVGKFNESISIYANAIDESVTGQRGLWYLEKGEEDNMQFDAGVDEILGYGTYYGLVITGDANVYFTDDYNYINQIILADAVYGYERATDESGNETINKVYVDYLISMLLDVYTGEYIDVNGNGKQDANEPTIVDIENTNTPVSLKAIEEAGYKVDYGMIQELLNTFGSNKDDILNHFYKSSYEMDNDKLETFIKSGKASTAGESYNGAMATYFYKYSAIDFKDFATNKNRVYMTFGYANDEANRTRFYNVKAYLTISTTDSSDTMCLFSNQATLNIAEADKITNGN